MLSIKDTLHLYRLKKKLRKWKGEYAADIEKAKKEGKKREEIEGIFAEMRGVCEYDELMIEEIYTREFTRKARKLLIEIPDKKEEKIWENNFGTYILTDHGKLILGKKIKAQRRKDLEFATKIIAMLTGLFGTLAALAAIIK